MEIPGFFYEEEFITKEEETQLISLINENPWNESLVRRTQHYGYIYDYSSKKAAEETTPIPEWCHFLMDRLMEKQILKEIPDQLIINEYLPGQGIYPHIDHVHSFKDGIVSISLNSDICMEFIHNNDQDRKKTFPLKRRSLLCLHGESRYRWRHGIIARKFDYGKPRGKRISLTFRKMNLPEHKRIRVE